MFYKFFNAMSVPQNLPSFTLRKEEANAYRRAKNAAKRITISGLKRN
jgi:hypothetical protein